MVRRYAETLENVLTLVETEKDAAVARAKELANMQVDEVSFLSSDVAVLCTAFFFLRTDPLPPVRLSPNLAFSFCRANRICSSSMLVAV